MDKPILFLINAAQSESFTTTQPGRGKTNLPDRDRMEHAQRLLQRFNETWNKLGELRQQRMAQALPSRDGCYVHIKGQVGCDLATNSLERLGKNGPRLISVQSTKKEGGKSEIQAIVYVPLGQEKKYLQQINDYATKIDPRWNQFKNKTLVESIEDVELALLENLWQDPVEYFPKDIPIWCELWLRTEDKKADEIVSLTQEICLNIGIRTNKERLDFPERTVIVIRANQAQLQELFEQSDYFAELRLAKEPVSFWSDMPNYEQTEAVDDLLQRIVCQDKGISICILDSGINNGHRLLEPFCSDGEKETYHPDWSPNDHKGHGTQMAGISVFGDLSKALESHDPIFVNHRIFSGKILPPNNFPENEAKLYGDITAQTISKCEIKIPDRKQHYCLAVTSSHETDSGRPSSWSAEIDKLAFGEIDGIKRLILVSAGNVPIQLLVDYPEINKTLAIQSPAQAWNALTVGAFTEKIRITDSDYREYVPLAQFGELSPHSTTSLSWDTRRWPNKPDIVLEGGNITKSPNEEIISCPDLELITTSHRSTEKQFELFNATRAATAKAAWMAAEIQCILPNAWPETIRALMVHSAEWTPQLIQQFGIDLSNRGDVETLLRVAGYGVPELEKASACATNYLTLVAQEILQPFRIEESQVKTNKMHFYQLPWPHEALQDLGDKLVTLKITLSYFIEPSPGELQTQNRYTYASHALRFDINTPQESDDIENFKKRVNKQARENEEDKPEYKGFTKEWKIGIDNRKQGTVQSDSITLSGIQMADCYHIAVYPVGGWWKTRKSEKCMEREARYSLIVSLHTEAQDIDIYTPVANMISVPIIT